jgi:hypothetical protein
MDGARGPANNLFGHAVSVSRRRGAVEGHAHARCVGWKALIDDLRHHGGGPVGRICWRIGLAEVTTRSVMSGPSGRMRQR